MMSQSQKRMNKTGWLAVLFFMLTLSASAQKTFKYHAKLDSVKSAGFYKIELPPAFVAKSNAALSDIRIVDARGKFVPYITSANMPHVNSEVFVSFPEVKSNADTGTAYVIENKYGAPINRLWLNLTNTAVSRTVNLYGSDDTQKWFAIEEDIALQTATRGNDNSYMQAIIFPTINYKYLKVLVNDRHKAPLKFLQAGIYTDRSVLNSAVSVPVLNFGVTDTGKTTHITINLSDNYLVNTIRLSIDSPKFYKRNVTVYAYNNQKRQLISNTDVMSGKDGDVFINAKTSKLEIEIANGDNPPLHLTCVNLWQTDNQLIAFLEAGQPYKLLTGDAAATDPDYDLKFFTDSIHVQLPKISAGKVEQNKLLAAPAIKSPACDYTILIWVVIAGALLLLTFLTVKMTKEVNKRNSNV